MRIGEFDSDQGSVLGNFLHRFEQPGANCNIADLDWLAIKLNHEQLNKLQIILLLQRAAAPQFLVLALTLTLI